MTPSRLTNDLLTSARLEAEAEQTRPEHLRLATALASYLEADREELGAVTVTCHPELVAVVDPSHLTRILNKYAGNAFKCGEPPVHIEAERVGDFVKLRVRDHGPGVPPEFVPPALYQVRPRRYASHSGDARNSSGPVDRQSPCRSQPWQRQVPAE